MEFATSMRVYPPEHKVRKKAVTAFYPMTVQLPIINC